MESGDDLLSRAVTSQVPSALKGLTAVFGMGTGGSPQLSPPEIVKMKKGDLCALSGISHSSLAKLGKSALKPGVYPVPENIDNDVANRKLEALGLKVDALTDDQQAYLESWQF